MNGHGNFRSLFFPRSAASGPIERIAYSGLLLAIAAPALLFNARVAHSGPCTEQIAQLERQIDQSVRGLEAAPGAPQSVDAQLHHQPTPETLQHAQIKANTDGDLAIAQARKADAAGDADACSKAINDAKRLYGID